MSDDSDYSYQLFKIAEERFQKRPEQLNQDEAQEAKRIIERKLHIEDVVLESADAVRVTVPESQVKIAVEQIRSRFETEVDFENDLAQIGINLEQLTESLTRELKVEAVMEAVCAQVPAISDTDASLYYYMNLSKFHQPETRIARHILVTINPDFPENEREQALNKLQAIAKRVGKKPERFAEQAQKHSECPTAMQGGLLGRVKKGILFEPVEQALFGLKAGEISDVVESEMGFHLVFCEAVTPEGPLPIQEVLPKLREQLYSKEKRLHQKNWLSNQLKIAAQNDSPRRTVNG